jgi:thiamine-monophosphate kinase
MRLSSLGENALIERIRKRFPVGAGVLGIGDDAAVFELPPGHSAVFCCDLLVENTHFIRNLSPPESIGYKSVAVNVSDVGAMGGTPMHFVTSLAAPGDLDIAWIDGFYSGVERACRDFGVTLVGGDTSSASMLFIDVAIVGRVPTGKAVLRSGARPGDKIYVTGELGGSSRGLALLKSGSSDASALQRHLYPQPRHRVGAAVAGIAHAMIDVSDGLSTDLGHIVTESGVSARIYEDRLPIAEGANPAQALHGGEEYELIIVAPELATTIEAVPLTPIGEILPTEAQTPQVYLVSRGKVSPLQPQGWDHYPR